MAPLVLALALAGPIAPTAAVAFPHDGRCGSEADAMADLADAFDIPVDGVAPEALVDTFDFWRPSGRMHKAIDIMAPTGTPVYAVDDGVITSVRENNLGGLIVTQLDSSGCVGLYYAHLNNWADGLEKGKLVERGDLIGFVGTTGNAQGKEPHLHFAAYHLAKNPGKFTWTNPLNPYWFFVPRENS